MPPRFLFQIYKLAPSANFQQRARHGRWEPPRPRGSNIFVAGDTTGRWYDYYNGQVHLIAPPPPGFVVPYKTWSFYFDSDSIWCYPDNAESNQVGDGSGNPWIGPQGRSTTQDQSDDDDDDDDDSPAVEDWRPLAFYSPMPNDPTFRSYATRRGPQQTLIRRRPNQGWVQQVIPRELRPNIVDPDAAAWAYGLCGELPILIALVAFSVEPHLVQNTLVQSFRQTYHMHNQPRGQACKSKSQI